MADDLLGDLEGLQSMSSQLRDDFADIRNILRTTGGLSREFTSELTTSTNASRKLGEEVERVKNGTSNTKKLLEEQAKATERRRTLEDKSNRLLQQAQQATGAQARNLRAQASFLSDAADRAQQLADSYGELAESNEKLDKESKFFDNFSKLTAKIPGLGKLSSTFKEAGIAIREATLRGEEGVEKLKQGFDIIGKASLILIAQQLLKLSTEVNNFQKNLNLSYEEALLLKGEFAAISFESGEVAVNSIRIAKANAELNSQLGTAAVFSGELLTTFSKLTEIVGLSNQAAGSLAQQALISGQEFRTVEENALGTSYALQQASGIALNNREILEATGKVTGQVRANLGSNPALIAEAVTKAKLLGMELNDIANTSKQLLNFESSIRNELEAELLTGKQLNLERARALALQGDLAGVADEIARQNINFAEFGAMNVLQQEALAKAVGMTADGLSDALLEQEAQGRTARELRALGKSELADRLEVLDAQERIALATEKLQVALSSVLTPLVPIVDLFAMIAGSTEVVYTLLGATIPLLAIVAAKQAVSFAKSIGKSVAEIFGGSVGSLGPLGIPIAIAGVGAMMGLIASSMTKADDMMYGNNMLITKNKGAIALNNDDTVIAGTDLFRGGGSGGGISDAQIGKLASAINDKKVTFDSFTSSGPQALVDTERRRASNLFF